MKDRATQKAENIKRTVVPAPDPALGGRVPAGQVATERFPILHEGEVPVYDMKEWTLTVSGELERAVTFTYEQIQALAQTELVCDIHCVTRWSKLDTKWSGVRFRTLFEQLNVSPEAKYVMVHADPDYDTNVPLIDLLRDDVLLAWEYDGKLLTAKHGWPLRLIVPHLYFWKSAKWIRGFEFMKEDRLGFWERNGFHPYADPFKEERFSGEALPIPEDEWTRKDYDS
jgi:DMSO/TMAO reductase YedYZ molybdopterin-dependent catalytic subunit